jgi:hypothetical protein
MEIDVAVSFTHWTSNGEAPFTRNGLSARPTTSRNEAQSQFSLVSASWASLRACNRPRKDRRSSRNSNAANALVSLRTGLVDWYTVWRDDGQGVVFTVFDTKSSADASLDEVRKIWSGLAGLLKGTPKAEVFDNVQTLGE